MTKQNNTLREEIEYQVINGWELDVAKLRKKDVKTFVDELEILFQSKISKAKREERQRVIEEIKEGLIKNEKGILLTGGDDNFVVIDSFLEFLQSLKKCQTKINIKR